MDSRPIISEVKQPPTRRFIWTPYEHLQPTDPGAAADHDPEQVLMTISEQTGLHFDKELRKATSVSVRPAP